MRLHQELRSYVFRNVLSTVGLSIYILADTLFIARCEGPNGLTALNLALPLFNLQSSLGLLLGMGGAILFSIHKTSDTDKSQRYFSQLIWVALGLGLFFLLCGLLGAGQIAQLLGASQQILPLAQSYLRIVLLASPLFILNNFCISFVRNDNNPQLTMMAMLTSCLFNILFDYIFMYPLGMGMAGAALATALSPAVSLSILSLHRKKANRLLTFHWSKPELANFLSAVKLGFPSFLTEISTGVSILFFNMMLLKEAGDIGVAAYGILANIQMVGLAIFTGTAQGIQPIVSREYGRKQMSNVKDALFFGLRVSFGLACALYGLILLFKLPVIQLFVEQENTQLTNLAATGLPIFLSSFLFSSLTIVLTIFFASVNKAKAASILVLLRGYLFIIPLVIVLGNLLEMTGIWMSLPISELLTLLIAGILLRNQFRRQQSVELP